MKIELSCSIVQDLLPNYIEKLTGDDTNRAVEQHLDSCEDCKNAYLQMVRDIEYTEKVPTIELKFFKKVKRTRLLAAALCVILTLILSWMIYASEYSFTNDKTDLAAGITEFIAPFNPSINAYVLETKELDGVLIATFKDQDRANVNGVAVLVKGVNQRYRIINAKIRNSDYSSVLQLFPIKIKNEPYYVVSGYSLANEIKHYGLDFAAYTQPGDLSKDRVRIVLKFEVENQQFLEIFSEEELMNRFEDSINEILYNPRLIATSMYAEDGKEITDNFKIQEDDGNQVNHNIAKAERFMLYVFIVIVMGLGLIITRYFLTE